MVNLSRYLPFRAYRVACRPRVAKDSGLHSVGDFLGLPKACSIRSQLPSRQKAEGEGASIDRFVSLARRQLNQLHLGSPRAEITSPKPNSSNRLKAMNHLLYFN